MIEPAKITIVEGPPPRFELVSDPWVLAMSEGPALPCTGRCIVRTINGSELVERCQGAWRQGQEAYLEYRTVEGLEEEALILAALSDESEEGEILHLWLRLNEWPEDMQHDEGSNTLDFGDEDVDNLM